MRTAADLLFCCLRRQSSAHAMWRVRLAAARLFLIKYILHPAPANAYRKHISCCRPHTISSHHRHALENRSTYTHTPPPGHASTHSLAGGEWARIRYTALNEQPGHEMKPLISPVRIPSCLWPLAMAAYPWSGRIGCTVLSTAKVSSL